MPEATWTSDDTRRIADWIRDIDICMFVTRADGTLRGRPMSNNGNVEYDGDSWFFSYRDSPKVEEIKADPRVELSYIATERGTWVSIEGSAEIVDDDRRKEMLWQDDLAGWFQTGPDDDAVTLIKVRADRVHAWAQGQEIVGSPDTGLQRVQDT